MFTDFESKKKVVKRKVKHLPDGTYAVTPPRSLMQKVASAARMDFATFWNAPFAECYLRDGKIIIELAS